MDSRKIVLYISAFTGLAFLFFTVLSHGQTTANFPPGFKEKVIYCDPGYDFLHEGHLKNGKEMVDFFVARGFVPKNAQELARWMKEKVDKKETYGTVCFIGMCIVPDSVLWEGIGIKLYGKARLINEYISANRPALLRQYMEAGGRVVWPTIGILFYQAEGEPKTQLPRSSAQAWLADIKFHPVFWGHALDGARGVFITSSTEEGRKWGLRGSYYMQLAVLADSVTTVLSGSEEFKVANFFLTTLNKEYPGSGIICLPTYTDGKDRRQMEDFYRLSLYAGTPVEVPIVQEPPGEAFPITIETFDGKNRARSAFMRIEDIAIKAQVENKSGKDFAGTAVMSVTDERANTLLKKKQPLQLSANSKAAIEANWSLKDAAVGDYRVQMQILEQEGDTAQAEHSSQLFIRPHPRQKGFFIAPLMEFPSNPVFRHRQAEAMGESRLAADLTHLTGENADLMFRYGVPFMLRLESGISLKGEAFVGGDVCHPKVIDAIGRQMAGPLPKLAGMPNLLPYAIGFDDWGAYTGVYWKPEKLAPHIKDEFKQLTGKSFPKAPLASPGHIEFPKGLVDPDNVWLKWNYFTADRLGKTFGKYAEYVNKVVPEMQLGIIPGEPPYFILSSGLYPPLIFGKDRLSLISYYFYMPFEPPIAHLYWLELGRIANRELSSLFMPDMFTSTSEMPSYTRSQIFAGLAAGAKIISHFRWEEAPREAKAEMLRLSKKLSPYMELSGSLKQSDKPVGLLIPFTSACFDGDYALHGMNVFNNLLCAHIDVEPVAEEEVLNDYVNPKRYKAIILSDVDWLRKDVALKLEKYIQEGGIVILDRMTEIEIKGAARIGIDLFFGVKEPLTEYQKTYGPPNITFPYYKSCRISESGERPYGDPKMLTSLCDALYPYVEPEVRSSADNLVIRRFNGEGAEYLWLVNVETKEEHDMMRKGYSGVMSFDKLVSYMQGRDINGQFKTTVSLPAGDYIIYDVLAGQRLTPGKQSGGRVVVPVQMQRFGGTLLALLDRKITGIKITGPRNINTGTPAIYKVKVDGPKIGIIPIEVKVTSPRGEEKEYSKVYQTQKGEMEVTIRPAVNDVSGAWTIKAKELYSGRETSIKMIRRREGI